MNINITQQRPNINEDYLELANFWALLSIAVSFEPKERNLFLHQNKMYGRRLRLAFKKFNEAVELFDTAMGELQEASKTPEHVNIHFDVMIELRKKFGILYENFIVSEGDVSNGN